MEFRPGCINFQGLKGFEKLGVDGVGVVVIEETYVLIIA